ncbi:MAG: hypothetical protein U0X92_11365 [Anaerolineales bacterium]
MISISKSRSLARGFSTSALLYVERGADVRYRRDCLHQWKRSAQLAFTFRKLAVVQFLRAALNGGVAPHAHFITETNVPHVDNASPISAMGRTKRNSSATSPCRRSRSTLSTRATPQTLSNWAKALTLPSDQTTFFNCLIARRHRTKSRPRHFDRRRN